jgi:hypothetical protein
MYYNITQSRKKQDFNVDLSKLIIRDTECYPNIWTFGGYNTLNGENYVFEVSDRVNQIQQFREAISHWKFHGYTMVGFNSIGYDYPVEHAVLTDLSINCAADIYKVSKRIIDTDWNDRFKNRIPVWQHQIPQIDLFLVHHFDNVNKSTSLKMLEFAMRMESIEDLPFKPEKILTHDEMTTLIQYQNHDIEATKMFTNETIEALDFRKTLSIKYNKNFMNHNDTKIGKDFFSMELEKSGVKLRDGNGDLRQTFREYIDLSECVIPWVQFERVEFRRILTQIQSTRVYETKGSLKLSAEIEGFKYDFGLGGIHGSVEGQIIKADDEFMIIDLDVASYYPNLAIKNKLYPKHLSEDFCTIYENVYKQRKQHAKGTPENAAMKLALNGVYGDSNSVYSPFYDPKFTMSITINGQLLLCILVEQLIKIPKLTVIQINTDGVTVKIPRVHEGQLNNLWEWWEKLTGLELEAGYYDLMAVRDVNNYIARYTDGNVKYNGAYDYTELGWNKNHSSLVVRKAACEAILNGTNIREFIMNHDDMFDFFSCVKAPRSARLELCKPSMWGDLIILDEVKVGDTQNVTRYYVSNDGYNMIKVMTPLKRKKDVKIKMTFINWISRKISGYNKNLEVTTQHEYNHAISLGYKCKDGGNFTHTDERRSEVESGYLTTPVNKITNNMVLDINYEYYINQANKLVNKVL